MRAKGIDYDGAIADRYADGRSLSVEAVATWRQAVSPLVPAHAPVVDVGAGTGRFTRLLASVAQGRVVAVEPAAGMRRSLERGSAVAGTAEALPLRSGSAGLVWSAFTTHYLDLEAAGGEFSRIVASSGEVAIWHAFPDVFDELEWFRWFPTARRIDEERMPTAAVVVEAFAGSDLEYIGRSEHRMLITADLAALADRLAHRSISTLHLISDDEFSDGLARLRAHAADVPPAPVYAPNVLLRFRAA